MKVTRRRAMIGGAIVLSGGLGAKVIWDEEERMLRASAFVGKAERYDDSLADVVRRGLAALGIGTDWARGKSVLIKPNLVEPTLEAPHINTHPALVRAVVEVFRSMDAREVFVAEGQGHVRDSYLVLEQSGLGKMISDAKISFVDLNHDEIASVPNALGMTKLTEIVVAQTVKRADRVVSLAKMKTHHWAGLTLSMKNCFGLLPGTVYGWPKNVLHFQGIERSIVDIVASVKPDLAIVDGVVGMEGDGPIMGTPKQSNVIVMGTNFPAVDATCARIMDFDPKRIPYLALSSGRLGPIFEEHIAQRGEPISAVKQRFQMLDLPHFKQFRA